MSYCFIHCKALVLFQFIFAGDIRWVEICDLRVSKNDLFWLWHKAGQGGDSNLIHRAQCFWTREVSVRPVSAELTEYLFCLCVDGPHFDMHCQKVIFFFYLYFKTMSSHSVTLKLIWFWRQTRWHFIASSGRWILEGLTWQAIDTQTPLTCRITPH